MFFARYANRSKKKVSAPPPSVLSASQQHALARMTPLFLCALLCATYQVANPSILSLDVPSEWIPTTHKPDEYLTITMSPLPPVALYGENVSLVAQATRYGKCTILSAIENDLTDSFRHYQAPYIGLLTFGGLPLEEALVANYIEYLKLFCRRTRMTIWNFE